MDKGMELEMLEFLHELRQRLILGTEQTPARNNRSPLVRAETISIALEDRSTLEPLLTLEINSHKGLAVQSRLRAWRDQLLSDNYRCSGNM